jgi:hypothetical protein
MASKFPALAPEAVAPDRDVPMALNRSFDRAAIAILGTMVTLIVMLTALLVTVSAPDGSDRAPTAQTTQSPHHA